METQRHRQHQWVPKLSKCVACVVLPTTSHDLLLLSSPTSPSPPPRAKNTHEWCCGVSVLPHLVPPYPTFPSLAKPYSTSFVSSSSPVLSSQPTPSPSLLLPSNVPPHHRESNPTLSASPYPVSLHCPTLTSPHRGLAPLISCLLPP